MRYDTDDSDGGVQQSVDGCAHLDLRGSPCKTLLVKLSVGDADDSATWTPSEPAEGRPRRAALGKAADACRRPRWGAAGKFAPLPCLPRARGTPPPHGFRDLTRQRGSNPGSRASERPVRLGSALTQPTTRNAATRPLGVHGLMAIFKPATPTGPSARQPVRSHAAALHDEQYASLHGPTITTSRAPECTCSELVPSARVRRISSRELVRQGSHVGAHSHGPLWGVATLSYLIEHPRRLSWKAVGRTSRDVAQERVRRCQCDGLPCRRALRQEAAPALIDRQQHVPVILRVRCTALILESGRAGTDRERSWVSEPSDDVCMGRSVDQRSARRCAQSSRRSAVDPHSRT